MQFSQVWTPCSKHFVKYGNKTQGQQMQHKTTAEVWVHVVDLYSTFDTEFTLQCGHGVSFTGSFGNTNGESQMMIAGNERI